MAAWWRSMSRDAWRDALRLGTQSAVAGAAAYLLAGWWGLDRFLVVMMAVTALARSVGGTVAQSLIRFESAAVGSVLGFLAVLAVPPGWGTAPAMGVALFAAGAAMALRASWQLAVVPVVGMVLAGREELFDTAGLTALGILSGAVLGFLVSLLVWPERAEARFERHYARALRATAARLSDAIAATVEEGHPPRSDVHLGAWHEAAWLAGEALSEARFVDRGAMERRLSALRDLHESVTILDRAAETASPPLSVEVMRGQVERLRRHAVEVLERLARGAPSAGRLGAVDRDLDDLRAAMAAEDPRAPEHEVHAAVAFGLRELRRTLAGLLEATG